MPLPGMTPYLDDDSPEGNLRRMIAGFSQPAPAAPGTPAPAATAPSTAAGAPPITASPIASPDAPPPITVPAAPSAAATRQTTDEAELGRLQSTGSGVSQLQHKHPLLGTIARIGDVALSSLLPGVAVNVPGTTAHHNVLEARQVGRVANDVGLQEEEAKTAQDTAAAAQMTGTTPVTINGYTYHIPTNQIKTILGAQIGAQGKVDVANINNKGRMDVATLQAQIAQGKVAKVLPWRDPQSGEIGVQAYNAQGQPLGVIPGALAPASYMPHSTDTVDYQQDAEGNIVALPKHSSSGPVLPGAPGGAGAPRGSSAPGAPGAGRGGPTARTVTGPDGKPLHGRTFTQRSDHSYEFNSGQLEKVGKPIDDTIGRMGRLEETLNQKNPQADALIGPELLSIMAGGAGTGLRMTEPEISRVIGGRGLWEDLKAKMQHWATNPEDARTITPSQDAMIRKLVGAVHDKLTQKQEILNDARQALREAQDPIEHRKIVTDAKREIDAIDAPEDLGGGANGTHKVGDVIIQNGQKFKVSAIDGAGKPTAADPI